MMVTSGGNCEGVAAVSMSAGGGTQGDLGHIKTSLFFSNMLLRILYYCCPEGKKIFLRLVFNFIFDLF